MPNENTGMKILETALDLFSQKGYDAVGVQEIAQACCVTKPVLYYHFSSKAGILEGIMVEYVEPFITRLEVASAYNGSVEEAIRNFAYCYVECFCQNMPLCMMLITMQYSPLKSEFYQVFVKHCSKIFDIVNTIFVKSRAQIGNMNGRERQFTMTLLSVLASHMYELNKQENPTPDRGEVDRLIHQFLHGIYS